MFKKTLLIFLLFSMNVFALEPVTIVNLEVTDEFLHTACPQPIWKSKFFWGGIEDRRPDNIIGDQETKGKTHFVMNQKTMTEVLDVQLKKLLQICGITFVSTEEVPSLSVTLEDFYAGVYKKGLTGKATAESRLLFSQQEQNQTTASVEMGVSLQGKRLKRKGIRQLTETLNKLLQETLLEVIKNKQINELLQ